MINMLRPLSKIATKAARFKPVAKILTKVSHNKPEIMAIGGGALVIWAAVEFVRGGMKLPAVMAETSERVEKIEAEQRENEKLEDGEAKTQLIITGQRELKKARTEGTWKVVKLFCLPSGLIVVGLALIGGGMKILRTRNVVLAGAAEGYKKILESYRKNVVKKEGKEADLNYMRGVIDGKEVETVVVDEKGKETTVKRRVPIVEQSKGNPWRFEFSDVYFDSYVDDPERNLFFLKCEEDWWNHELERHEEVSMYEILKHLGYRFEIEKAAAKDPADYRKRMTFLRNYGWRKGCGDGFIDFGLYRAINDPVISRKSEVVWIEFNCSGNLENLTERDYTKTKR
jgi:hypothetical protein